MIPEKLQVARLQLVRGREYLADVVFRMPFVERETMPGTLGTASDERGRFFYVFSVIEAAPQAQVTTMLYHEVWHFARRHVPRGRSLATTPDDWLQWNIAADEEINGPMLTESPLGVGGTSLAWELPHGHVTAKGCGHPEGLSAEEYFALHGSAGQGGGGCASCQPGQPWHEARDGEDEGMSHAEASVLARMTAERIDKAANSAPGTVPQGWLRWANEVLAPVPIPWWRRYAARLQAVLGARRGQHDWTYRRPRSSPLDANLVLPGMAAPEIIAALVIDTSGSMDDEQVRLGLRVTESLIRAIGGSLTVLSCDAAVHTVREVASTRHLQIAGGGGTDMRVGLDRALMLRPKPRVVIVWTDGETPWPDSAPRGVTTLVLRCGHGTAPAWAFVVDVT